VPVHPVYPLATPMLKTGGICRVINSSSTHCQIPLTYDTMVHHGSPVAAA